MLSHYSSLLRLSQQSKHALPQPVTFWRPSGLSAADVTELCSDFDTADAHDKRFVFTKASDMVTNVQLKLDTNPTVTLDLECIGGSAGDYLAWVMSMRRECLKNATRQLEIRVGAEPILTIDKAIMNAIEQLYPEKTSSEFLAISSFGFCLPLLELAYHECDMLLNVDRRMINELPERLNVAANQAAATAAIEIHKCTDLPGTLSRLIVSFLVGVGDKQSNPKLCVQTHGLHLDNPERDAMVSRRDNYFPMAHPRMIGDEVLHYDNLEFDLPRDVLQVIYWSYDDNVMIPTSGVIAESAVHAESIRICSGCPYATIVVDKVNAGLPVASRLHTITFADPRNPATWNKRLSFESQLIIKSKPNQCGRIRVIAFVADCLLTSEGMGGHKPLSALAKTMQAADKAKPTIDDPNRLRETGRRVRLAKQQFMRM